MKSTTIMLSHEQALQQRQWFVIDAGDQVLGRIASAAAQLLRGKGKPSFTPHVDCGDFVVIVNAERVKLTGNKGEGKIYYRHSEYPGGLRAQTANRVRASHPDRLLRLAVEGMLPKNRLGRQLATKLKIYAGSDHPHAAQKPTAVSISA